MILKPGNQQGILKRRICCFFWEGDGGLNSNFLTFDFEYPKFEFI